MSGPSTLPAAPAGLAGEITAVVAAHAFRYAHERELQDGLAQVLGPLATRHGLAVDREVVVPGAGRIDLVLGRVGVEVKVGGAPAAVGRQIRRYQAGPFDALVLVTTRVAHLALTYPGPPPVHVVAALNGAF